MVHATPDARRIRKRLARLYPGQAEACWQRIEQQLAQFQPHYPQTPRHGWDQRDTVLITYGDQVRSPQRTPLATLHHFLQAQQLQQLIGTVHLLPFFPYSSDDGFSVIDYRAVDPQLGTWDDIQQLGRDFHLMYDLVLNHVSQQSVWFDKYRAGEPPFDRFFIECDPATDLSAVVRPRTSPLLTPVSTSRGERHLWTTFSADQVDLNYAEPAVLFAMLEVLLEYVARGARIVRLDAIAYLWKRAGTPCIHLPETHEVVKLMRDVLQIVAPHVLLLTETNVPHRENVSYFGEGDEAHLVYQFSLPPLLLDALLSRDAGPLRQWLATLEAPRPGTSYFNFTASHDGIGVRPLEGLVDPQRLDRLIAQVRDRGGLVSSRQQADGRDSPYELNITYLDALGQAGDSDLQHAQRFLASQAIMLALRGIPAIYFHSLVGTRNDRAGVEESGQPRRINRHKYSLAELNEKLLGADTLAQTIFRSYRHLLATRIEQPAFHPDAEQQVLEWGDDNILAFRRTALADEQVIVVAANFGRQPQRLDVRDLGDLQLRRDLITGQDLATGELTLSPDQVVWLST